MNRRKFVGSMSLGMLALLFPWFKPKQNHLIGYTGQQYLDTGYVYAPYRPLIFTDYDSKILARYKGTRINPNFYSTWKINNTP